MPLSSASRSSIGSSYPPASSAEAIAAVNYVVRVPSSALARAALERAKAWGFAPEQAAKMLRKSAKAREPKAEQCYLFGQKL